MKVLAEGDWHGNREFIQQFYDEYLPTVQVDKIVHTGDLTVAWGPSDCESFFDFLAELVARSGIPFYFIDGNHEYFDVLFERYLKGDTERFVEIRPNLFYIPRGYAWEWDGVRFMGFGGAYSIKGSSSVMYQNWFPNEEQASYADIERAMSRGKVDVLITHDAPLEVEQLNQLYLAKPNEGCQASRKVISAIVESCQPKIEIHGHHHYDYSEIVHHPWGDVKTIGLSADYTSTNKSQCAFVLDTELVT
jgi:Icc-related predicted phosphoesterase